MFDGAKLKTMELEFVEVSAFGIFCSHFLQWTRPTSFIHKTMNSTAMCLLPEQTGHFENNQHSNQCADMQ